MSQDLRDRVEHDTRDTDNDLISADRVAGTTVYDLSGEKLGTVHSIMIDKISGKVSYVVISFGGTFGIGTKHHPLPWNMLEYDTGLDGYRVDIANGDLEGAPSYDRDEIAGFGRGQRDEVDRHYARPDGDDSRINRSDLNDGIERPLGFYSRKAQSLRNGAAGGTAGSDPEGLKADEDAPGFFSPEQQKARSQVASIDNTVGGAQGVHAREVDSKGDLGNER